MGLLELELLLEYYRDNVRENKGLTVEYKCGWIDCMEAFVRIVKDGSVEGFQIKELKL